MISALWTEQLLLYKDLVFSSHEIFFLFPEDDDVPEKIVSQPSLEASNAEWWENEYFDYKKNGGDLPFEQFKQMMINEADIEMTKQINKRVKDRLKDEGLAALLGVRA